MVGEKSLILLDISRLLWRAKWPAATGIDRVELAYARYLLDAAPERLAFTAINRWGQIVILPFERMERFARALDRLWKNSGDPQTAQTVATQARVAKILSHLPGIGDLRRAVGNARNVVYLLVSHHHLERTRTIERLKETTGARFVCFIHDTIPLDYPQFNQASQVRNHRQRMDTVSHLADAVIVNSASTKEALARFLPTSRPRPIVVAHLGVEGHLFVPADPVAATRPYFVCVSTVEPRKNQGLLLTVWKKLRSELRDAAPRLILVGRARMSDHIIREIAQSAELSHLVIQHDFLPDAAMARLVAGARASLLPSLAEGYGLSVVEALALGVPVLCSDLPSLREIGGAVPEYLAPLDEAAWLGAVRDYLQPDSERRRAQIARLSTWRAPRWSDHFALVRELLDGEGGQPE